MIKLAIFDLDGTLLNTIADLAASTNHALTQLGHPTHETDKYNFMVGNGINKLFERALPEGQKTQENISKMRSLFIAYYAEHLTDKSKPYEGILHVLESLTEKGIALAVATNKYQAGSETLIKHFFSHIPFKAVLGQREGIPTKPDPQVINEILQIVPVKNSEVLYIGDSDVDMQTAKNAQLIGCGVSWGFRPIEELQKYNPQFIVNTPLDILSIIDKYNN
ncbi:HAD family hydrolase [Bacteroides coprosuis]|uniref:HAD family hydrolase n=1 Tax=Bacteroides coprosuis TaxID=151276 RepID=UPI001D843A7D|nr:HAD family hydrolase [Bacteroides coprosuis]HJD92032.1 HAD family hydrolase [Bacteroides coprosuis]